MRSQALVAFATLLALSQGLTAELCDGASCEDEEWAAESSFIQQNLQILHREEVLQSVTESAAEHSVDDTILVPASASVDVDGFGSRVAKFPFWVITSLLTAISLLVLHEFFVSQGMKPLLARNLFVQDLLCQILGLLMSMWVFLQMSMMIPLSLDFALSLGHGGTASGFYLSAGVLLGLLGIGVGKALVDEARWKQSFARRLALGSHVLTAAVNLALAVFINTTVESKHVHLVWWTCILLGQVSMFTMCLPAVPIMIFWSKITPPENRTFWMTLGQCSRNMGLVLGPLVYSVARAAISGEAADAERVSPRSMMAWVHLVLVWVSMAMATFTAIIVPTQLPERKPFAAQAAARPAPAAVEQRPEDLDDEKRQTMVWHQVCYSLERPFTLAAVEVSTLMMLEVFYGWDPYFSGICFTAICSLGIAVALAALILVQAGYIKESSLLFVATCSAIVGCSFLFDEGHAKAWTLLLAEAIIYTGGTVAIGISQGWATRAAKEGSNFSQADYQMWNMVAVTTGRFMGPIIGRLAVHLGGRNVYACMQLLLCCLGTRSVYKSCKLVWSASDGKHQMPREVGKANCALTVSGKGSLFAPEDSPNISSLA